MKYRVIELNGKEVLLREDEVQELIKRFDPEHNYVECILCKRYPACTECPVGIFRNKPLVGCEVLIQHVLGEAAYPEPIARSKRQYKVIKEQALKLKKWFESLPIVTNDKEVNNEV